MKKRIGMVCSCIVGWMALAGASAQEASSEEVGRRIEVLEEQVGALTEELEKQTFGDVVSRPGASVAGMGPAASKVYHRDEGVSIGGYGEAVYQDRSGDGAQADFLRAVIYVGYKFNEKWVFNSETEFEHASTDKEGSASLEFAYLDYLAGEALNFRAGLVLVPMGLVNELHEPTTFLPVNRAQTERRIIPSTWRENGIGLYGSFAEAWSYKAYVVNGLRGEDFSESGFRGGRQKGSKAQAEDLAGVLRLDYSPMEGVTVGVSGYAGQSGQELDTDAMTLIGDLHADIAWGGWRLRGVAAYGDQEDAAELTLLAADPEGDAPTTGVAENLWGWYIEGGYDLLAARSDGEASLIPYVRYEQIDTQDGVPDGFEADASQAEQILTLGIAFQPLDEIIFKADYEFVENDADTGQDRFNLGLGYIF